MTRLMGDAIHVNVPQLSRVPGLQLAAGYVTGSPDVVWTPGDWEQFPLTRIIRVPIDQGFTGSPVPAATVRDVEPGAWSPAAAIKTQPWTPERPTIYCDRNDLTRLGGILDLGWQGDIWLAFPGWQPGQPLPDVFGATIVAVQNRLDVQNAYDLSVVLDPYWPAKEPDPMYVEIPGVPGRWLSYTAFTDYVTGTEYVVGTGTTGGLYYTRRPRGGVWSGTAAMP